MILIRQKRILLFIIFIFHFIPAKSCNRSCNHKDTHFPFPFGFSEDCEIPLNCSPSGDVLIGDYRVRNVTSDSILIDLPPECNRSIQKLNPLFSKNYALTSKNDLLLYNCTPPEPRCRIPTSLVETHFQIKDCSFKNASMMSCFSKEGEKEGFMNFTNVNNTQCEFFYSSIAVDSVNNSSVSLELNTVQLGWWLEGGCDNCSANSNCMNFSSPFNESKQAFRCSCKEGFVGDGFNAGDGCKKVSSVLIKNKTASSDSSPCNLSRYMSGRCGGTTRVVVLVGGIVAGASIMAGLALICYFIRRRSSSLKSHNSTKRLLSEATGSSHIPFYPYKEIAKATNSFSEKQRLGTGAYGTVYAGKLHNDEWVAIKKIKHRDTDGIEQVMNEIKLLSSVSHPNLVRLLGCCIEGGEQILVYEYMPNGTLSQHLQREKGKVLPWTTRLTIATETAQAISHLHSSMNPPIYHRDIKSSNILLDYNYKSKVADFGLSRLGMTETSHISTAPQGTPGYLDPQYHQNFHLSDKSDVYSFGVVLVEIITALKVVDFSRPHSEVNLAALAVDKIGKGCVEEIIDPFLEPHRDSWTLSSLHKVAELAFRCLAYHRDMRPSMIEVAAELENIRLSAWAPLEMCTTSSVASSCSSPSSRSEKSLKIAVNKVGILNRRLVAPQRSDSSTSKETKDNSPVSVQDPWFSEKSSPSTNSLLGNVIQ